MPLSLHFTLQDAPDEQNVVSYLDTSLYGAHEAAKDILENGNASRLVTPVGNSLKMVTGPGEFFRNLLASMGQEMNSKRSTFQYT